MLLYLVCLLIKLSPSISMVLEGHYKPWDSASTKYLYDYSLNNRHIVTSFPAGTYPIVSTDRGMYIRDQCEMFLPSNKFSSSPGTQDSIFSMWVYFLTNGRVFLARDTRYSLTSYSLRIFLNLQMNTQAELKYSINFQPETILTHNTNPSDLYGVRWRFLVCRFQQEGSDTTFTIYSNTVEMFKVTINNFYINLPYINWTMSSNGGFFTGLIYEMWWHSGMTSISELDSIMTSDTLYVTPTSLTVPTYDFTYSSANQLCQTTCTGSYLSCDSNLECIGASESSCYYNFLQTTTNQCIFNCPNNSCICTTGTTFTCNCKTGYKKVNDNPIACIDIRCQTYTQTGYLYTCTCPEGYILDLNYTCICDSGYIIMNTNPLKCGFDTFRCINYVEGPSLYTCTQCQQGYIVGCSGKCCVCDSGYQVIQENPIQCGLPVSRCKEYQEINNLYYCSRCIEGYILGCSGTCCICDTNSGYLEFSSNPLKCRYEVFRCANYVEGDALFTCSSCIDGYTLDISGKSCICERYAESTDGSIKCAPTIDNCISYIKIDGEWVCGLCSTGYKVDPYSKCLDCDVGYSIVTNNPFTCTAEIIGCAVYSSYNDEWICEDCSVGYRVACDGRCCECNIEGGYIQVAQNPIVCILEIEYCLEYKIYDTIWGCGVCEIGYDIDTELHCNKCQEGYIEYSDNNFLCLLEIKHCEIYTLLRKDHICSKCEEGYSLYQNECYECKIGYYVPKSNPELCLQCPNNCIYCNEFESEIACVRCSFGYEVIDGMCECDLEDFYMRGDYCVVRPLKVSLSYEHNFILVSFSKKLANTLTSSDLVISFLDELDSRLLIYEIIHIEDTYDYLIIFEYLMNINQVFSISITFSDNVSDRQNQELVTKTHYTELPIKFEGITTRSEYCDSSCKECEIVHGKLACSSCYAYALVDDGICRCYVETVDSNPNSCSAKCPKGMIVNSDLKQCVYCEDCFNDTTDNVGDSQEETLVYYKNIASDISISSTAAALTMDSVIKGDKIWSFMNTLQIYSYLPLYNVNMPLYLQKSLKSQDSTSKYFDTFKELFPRYSKPFDKAVSFKYESASFIRNAIKPIMILLNIIILNALVYAVNRNSSGKLKKYSSIILNHFNLSIYLRYFTQVYMDIIIPCTLQLIYVLLFIIIYRPYLTRAQNLMQIVNEVCISLAYIFSGLYYWEIELDIDLHARVILSCVFLSYILHLTAISINFIKFITNKLRACRTQERDSELNFKDRY